MTNWLMPRCRIPAACREVSEVISVMNSGRLKNRRWVRRISFVIMVAICLSTVFLKQHSVADVTGALALAYVMYQFVYGNVYVFSRRTARQKVTG